MPSEIELMGKFVVLSLERDGGFSAGVWCGIEFLDS